MKLEKQMRRIKLLPDMLINRIAAGEVVERPSAVLKELLENSLDSGADRIEIEVQGGGKKLIEIKDNGRGMDEDDLMMCLERHATSKINAESDLFHIDSLGFRGEAIPSIGSVSHLTITSATEAGAGHQVTVAGGRLENFKPVPANPGTTVSVRNLFYNVPARKKFLKAEPTESAHLLDVAQSYALSCPNLSLTFRDGARDIFMVESRHDFQTRVFRVLGRAAAETLRPFKYFGQDDLTITGWLGGPEKVMRSTSRLFIYVRGRPVKDRLLNKALATGYGRMLAPGTWPVAVVFIDIDPALVDVNVHPSKAEVRFRDPSMVFSALAKAVELAVGSSPVAGADGSYLSHKEATPTQDYNAELGRNPFPTPNYNALSNAQKLSPTHLESPPDFAGPRDLDTIPPWMTSEGEGATGIIKDNKDNNKDYLTQNPTMRQAETKDFNPNQQSTQQKDQENLFTLPTPTEAEGQSPEIVCNFEELHPLGQIYQSYILAQGERGLYIVDQHAAHERIIFDQLKKKLAHGLPGQTLLFPDTMELPPQEALAAEKLQPHLARLGFDLQPFGEQTYILKSAPTILNNCDPWPPLLEILGAASGRLSSLDGAGLEEALVVMSGRWLYSLACRAAIKAGEKMTMEAMEQLLKDMSTTAHGAFCPHGRPAIQLYDRREIEKRFGRH